MNSSLAITALTFVAFVLPAAAHDFWIEPSSFHPAKDTRVAIDMRVGEHFVGDAVVRNPAKIERFVALQATAERTSTAGDADAAVVEKPIVGIDNKAPVGFWRPPTEGLYWIVYRSRTTAIELEAVKFEAYLRSEGLDHVLAAREKLGTSAQPGKEIYSRCAKSLLSVGPAPHTGCDRPTGLTLEVVPEGDPTALHVGDDVAVRIVFREQPLAHALVGCLAQADPTGEVRVRSDDRGRVHFKLAQSGPTLVRVVHMAEAPKDSGADWESFWASMSFETRPADAPAAPANPAKIGEGTPPPVK